MKWLRKRILDLLLTVGVVVVVIQRVLRDVPEIFPGGAAMGDILATLATGYIGAWFFNLMNLRLPKKREKRAVLSIVGVAIAQYSGQARGILQEMATSLSLPPVPRRPDREILRTILSRINPNELSNALSAPGLPFSYLSWIQRVSDAVRGARTSLDRIAVAYPHLAAETVSAISAIDSTSLVRIVHNYPTFPPMNNSTLDIFEDMFWDYWTACSSLGDRYNEEVFPLLDEKRRLHIDADERTAGEGWSQLKC